MSQILPNLTSLITILLIAIIPVVVLWFKIKVYFSSDKKKVFEKEKKEIFKILLDEHFKLLIGANLKMDDTEWHKNFSEVSKGIILWGSNNMINHYGNYCERYLDDVKCKTECSDREVHFAKAVLAFRKSIGKRNWFYRIKPKHIIYIFRFTYKGTI
jgi:hypothetical protein